MFKTKTILKSRGAAFVSVATLAALSHFSVASAQQQITIPVPTGNVFGIDWKNNNINSGNLIPINIRPRSGVNAIQGDASTLPAAGANSGLTGAGLAGSGLVGSGVVGQGLNGFTATAADLARAEAARLEAERIDAANRAAAQAQQQAQQLAAQQAVAASAQAAQQQLAAQQLAAQEAAERARLLAETQASAQVAAFSATDTINIPPLTEAQRALIEASANGSSFSRFQAGPIAYSNAQDQAEATAAFFQSVVGSGNGAAFDLSATGIIPADNPRTYLSYGGPNVVSTPGRVLSYGYVAGAGDQGLVNQVDDRFYYGGQQEAPGLAAYLASLREQANADQAAADAKAAEEEQARLAAMQAALEAQQAATAARAAEVQRIADAQAEAIRLAAQQTAAQSALAQQAALAAAQQQQAQAAAAQQQQAAIAAAALAAQQAAALATQTAAAQQAAAEAATNPVVLEESNEPLPSESILTARFIRDGSSEANALNLGGPVGSELPIAAPASSTPSAPAIFGSVFQPGVVGSVPPQESRFASLRRRFSIANMMNLVKPMRGYVRASLGMGTLSDVTQPLTAPTVATYKHDWQFGGEIAAGAKMPNLFGNGLDGFTEVEGSYKRASLDDIEPASLNASNMLSGYTSLLSGMVNMGVEAPMNVAGMGFTPYAGAGLGFAMVMGDTYTASGAPLGDIEGTGLSAQVLGGVKYKVMPNLSLNVGAKYQWAFGLDVKNASTGAVTEQDLNALSGNVGLTFDF